MEPKPDPFDKSKWAQCRQCGDKMNPAERMLGPVCGKCCRKNHLAAMGASRKRKR